MDCPTCGHPVRIYSGGEGTNSYEPLCEADTALKAERDSLQVALLERGKELVALEAERDKLAAQVLSLTLERDVARAAVSDLETVCARLSAIPK